MDDRFCWDCHDAKGSPANSLHQVREICWAAPELVDEVLRGLVYRHELRTREGTNHDICRHWIRVSVSRFRSHSPRASHGRRGKPHAEGRCLPLRPWEARGLWLRNLLTLTRIQCLQ